MPARIQGKPPSDGRTSPWSNVTSCSRLSPSPPSPEALRCSPPPRTPTPARPTTGKSRRSWLESCVSCHRPEPDRADVAADLRRGSALGQVDRQERPGRDACRPGTPIRRSATSPTTAGSPRPRSTRCVRWVQSGAPEGDPADRPAPADLRRRRVDPGRARSGGDARGGRGPGRQVRRVPQADRPRHAARGSLDPGGRVPAGQSQGPPPHHRVPGEGLRGAGPPGRLAGRLGGRHRSDGVPAGHRTPAAEGRQHPGRHALPPRRHRREGHHPHRHPLRRRRGEQGAGQHLGAERRLRDPRRRQEPPGGVELQVLAERQDHGADPPHALPRRRLQVHRLLPRRTPGSAAQRAALGLQLADQLRAGAAAHGAGRNPGRVRRALRQLAPTTRSIPIRPETSRSGSSPTTR